MIPQVWRLLRLHCEQCQWRNREPGALSWQFERCIFVFVAISISFPPPRTAPTSRIPGFPPRAPPRTPSPSRSQSALPVKILCSDRFFSNVDYNAWGIQHCLQMSACCAWTLRPSTLWAQTGAETTTKGIASTRFPSLWAFIKPAFKMFQAGQKILFCFQSTTGKFTPTICGLNSGQHSKTLYFFFF